MTMKRNIFFILICLTAGISFASAQSNDTINISEALSITMPRIMSETIFTTNPVETDLVDGTWKAPKAGDKITVPDGTERFWTSITADEKGWIRDTIFGIKYIYATVEMKNSGVMILQLMGNDMVYVNGSPRIGNPYGTSDSYNPWENDWNFVTLPVELHKGKNELLFRASRGRIKARLYQPSAPAMFIKKDFTTPDFLVGEKADTWAGVTVINATNARMDNLQLRVKIGEGKWSNQEIPVLQPTALRKIGVKLMADAFLQKGETAVYLELVENTAGKQDIIDRVTIPIRIVEKTENQKATFISDIDGSVQYYSVLPPRDYDGKTPTGLFLSVHGAAVEAINQTGSYAPKTWGMVVSPTNRRPYGFNWEDWGRLDAMEVLQIAKSKYKIDESRVYLTGHSMGGHGTWHLGAMFPDHFAAISPSAGWISFWSYRFRGQNVVDTSAVRKMIRRSTTPSETMSFAENYKQQGVYVIHGEIDDNVRIDQAIMMIDRLKEINHPDYQYHFQPDANHWWDLSDERGADCVDWPPLFDFFARHARPLKDKIRQVDFLTANPGISSRNNWLVVDAQEKQLAMSEVHVLVDPYQQRFTGTTSNVTRIAFDLDILPANDTVSVTLDGQIIRPIKLKADQQQLWLEKTDTKWRVADKPSVNNKNSIRYGTFKDAFRHRMLFVYGTKGTTAENQWAYDKARYDAEKFWYQGNGSIEVIPDTDFNAASDPDRSVILYGNSTTNSAWKMVLSDSPVQVTKGSITAGSKTFAGNDLACMCVRPRAGSATAYVAFVSGTGIKGMKLTTRLPYMNPGIGLPDCTILNQEILTKGDEGVLMTGFFGPDWSLDKGEFVPNP
jgi:poly(3-hydroxybutyrate) depolymerase